MIYGIGRFWEVHKDTHCVHILVDGFGNSIYEIDYSHISWMVSVLTRPCFMCSKGHQIFLLLCLGL